MESHARKPSVESAEPCDDDAGAGAGAAAVEDDEAFARRLQEEENRRYERERAESRRRAEEWRRTHEALMFAADDPGPDPFGDFGDAEDDDDRDGSDDEDERFSERASLEGEEDADEDGEADVPARDARRGGADGDAEGRRNAARRARGGLARMHRFFGAMHAHIHAAGRDARERGDLAALVLSDRDFTDQDYERLLTLDNVCVAKKGLSADAMARRGVVTRAWGENQNPSDAPRCAVCLEGFSRGDCVSRLPCTHQFHRACIERWLSSHVECPVCRVNLAEVHERR